MGQHTTMRYEIRVQGRLDERWSTWFGGATIVVECEDPPVTRLACAVVDSPQLYGILSGIRDLNLTLLSVARVEDEEGGRTDEGGSG